jgi:tetratricopeptide (TPR) repeat protein
MALGCAQANADAAANKGQSCYIAGDYSCAVKAYGIAVREDPKNAAHHYDLAMSLLAAKMPAQAVPELRETIRLDPAHTDARRHLERLMR